MARAYIVIWVLILLIYPAAVKCQDTEPRPVDPDKGISADIFGKKGGRFHPFVLLRETYTDNLYQTDSDKKDDFITTLSPGIWVAVPGMRTKTSHIKADTVAPGGLQLSRMKPDTPRRFQAYALYSADFVNHSAQSNENHINHGAQALLQYNFSSGLSIDLLDMFADKEQPAGNGVADTLYRHQDNLLNLICAYYSPSGNLKLKLDYSNYYLDYKDSAAGFRDRVDNSASFSAGYKVLPKTYLFAGYGFTDIDFDTGSANDSVENQIFSGVSWNMSGKTKAMLKLGYLEKDFDQQGISDQEDFSLELQGLHTLHPGSRIKVGGYRRFNEADIPGASSFLTTGIIFSFSNQFTPKWSAELNALFEKNNYNEIDREDDFFSLNPAIHFTAKKWLMFDLEYTYENNDSGTQLYDYELHQFYLGASLTM